LAVAQSINRAALTPTEGEIDAAFVAMARERPDALLLGPDPFLVSRREQIVTLANQYKLGPPALQPSGGFAHHRATSTGGEMCQSVMVILLATTFLASVPMSAFGAPDKGQYELQERCSNRVQKIFANDWPSGSSDNSMGYTQYQSHYNAKLNKCFVLITIRSYDKPSSDLKTLLDVFSNKEYGQYLVVRGKNDFPPTCYVGDKICNSEGEWDAMADVYMKEDGTGYNLRRR
jgi:hypothetical protein